MKILVQVLDGTYGKPAVGVRASLARVNGNGSEILAEAETDQQGCIDDWDRQQLERGIYRAVLDTDRYFASLGAASAYPEVSVIFRMHEESSAFQVQVTLAPSSYSTYFGTTENGAG
jgi:5-hydroxyisourate hydrolase